MRRALLRLRSEFRIAMSNRRAQAAEMALSPGGKEGGPANRHRGSDQWLYVAAGRGEAVVNGRHVVLAPGTLLLIERGDEHEIRNNGRARLRTLNFYVPPAYDARGTRLSPGRP